MILQGLAIPLTVTVEHYASYMGPVSVCLALAAFLISVVVSYGKRLDTPLQDHLGRAVGAGTVPSALVLICAGFYPALLTKVPGLEVPIAFGGMALLYVAFKTALR